MKGTALISILTCSAALAFTGCNEVKKDESSAPVESLVTEPSTKEETTTIAKPTDRVPEIQTNELFEYEILNGEAVIEGYTGDAEEVEIPAEIDGAPVTKIGTYAFEANYDITSVTLPETVALIGEGAFMDCGSLESINIPEAVKGIDRGAFVSCTSLTEITIPAAVEYVREEAFTACEGLFSLTIENPDLAYENWGLEELPELEIYAPEGSAAAAWASELGKLAG